MTLRDLKGLIEMYEQKYPSCMDASIVLISEHGEHAFSGFSLDDVPVDWKADAEESQDDQHYGTSYVEACKTPLVLFGTILCDTDDVSTSI